MAVNVTDWPYVEELALLVTATVVGFGLRYTCPFGAYALIDEVGVTVSGLSLYPTSPAAAVSVRRVPAPASHDEFPPFDEDQAGLRRTIFAGCLTSTVVQQFVQRKP